MKFVFRNFKDSFYRSRGRLDLVFDGTKQPKEGGKIPGAHLQHSCSQDTSKPKYFQGLHFQVESVLIEERVGENKFTKAVTLCSKLTDKVKMTEGENKKFHDVSFEMIHKTVKIIKEFEETKPITICDSY